MKLTIMKNPKRYRKKSEWPNSFVFMAKDPRFLDTSEADNLKVHRSCAEIIRSTGSAGHKAQRLRLRTRRRSMTMGRRRKTYGTGKNGRRDPGKRVKQAT